MTAQFALQVFRVSIGLAMRCCGTYKPLLVFLGVVALGLGAGCHSAEKKTSVSDALVLSGNTPGQISEMIVEVFKENGYTISRSGLTKLVLEKKASLSSNIAYGNWIGSKPVYIRSRISLVPVAEATFRIDYTSVLVRDINETTEEELKIRPGQHDCRKLLDEAARRLGAVRR